MHSKTKLSALAMGIESSAIEEEHVTCFDRESGEMVYLEREMLRSVEEDPDNDDSDFADWQQKEIKTARALLADDGTRFIDPPHSDAHDEFEVMRKFAQQRPDKVVASDLLAQLGGRGSFRGFMDAIFEHRIEDAWRTFQDEKQRELLIAWCRENRVVFEDDLHVGPQEYETSDRDHLLVAAKWFVEEAAKLEGIEKVALVGSLCTEQRKPRDLDLLVFVSAGASVKSLAKLRRGLQGNQRNLY